MYIKDNAEPAGKPFELIECPHCGNKVSTQADKCWKCGNAIDHATAKKVVEVPPPPKKGWEEISPPQ